MRNELHLLIKTEKLNKLRFFINFFNWHIDMKIMFFATSNFFTNLIVLFIIQESFLW